MTRVTTSMTLVPSRPRSWPWWRPRASCSSRSSRPIQHFQRLDPPPGGLAGLRVRLARERFRERRYRLVGGAVGLCTTAAVAIWIALPLAPAIAPGPNLFDAIEHPALVHLGLEASPIEPVTALGGDRIALRRMPTGRDDVVFYLVGSPRSPR